MAFHLKLINVGQDPNSKDSFHDTTFYRLNAFPADQKSNEGIMTEDNWGMFLQARR